MKLFFLANILAVFACKKYISSNKDEKLEKRDKMPAYYCIQEVDGMT